MNHSHQINAIQDSPEITRKLITIAEDHGSLKFPSWRAAMINEHAVKIRKEPTRSNCRKEVTILSHILIDFGLNSSVDASG